MASHFLSPPSDRATTAEWPDENYPTLVFVLPNNQAGKNFKRYAEELLEDNGRDGEVFVNGLTIDEFSNSEVKYTLS